MHLVALTKGVDTHKFLSWTVTLTMMQIHSGRDYSRLTKQDFWPSSIAILVGGIAKFWVMSK